MGIEFVHPEKTRLYLVDVYRRAHEALTKRTKPRKATTAELAESAAAVALAEQQGAWIEVRKRLNAGEQRAMHNRLYVAGVDGRLHVNHFETGLAMVTAYLLDWSASSDPIRGVSAEEVSATLNALDPESFAEIRAAIDFHIEAVDAARRQEKNVQAGERNASAISPSPSESAGALSGSVN